MEPVVILAGGKSRRMGRDKLSLDFGGVTLLESAVTRYAELFQVYISVSESARYPEIKAGRIADIIPGAGPMSGLHAALTQLSSYSGVFLTAADMPYTLPQAALRIIELCGDDYECCVIRQEDGRLEPLFGYYKRTLLSRCTALLESGERRMSELILAANTRYVSPNELFGLWNDKMLLNINYPEDYEKII